MTSETKNRLDLPWRVADFAKCDIEDRDGVSIIRDGDCDSDWVDLWPEQRDYIVKAVNNHEALLRFIRDVSEVSNQPYLRTCASNILYNLRV